MSTNLGNIKIVLENQEDLNTPLPKEPTTAEYIDCSKTPSVNVVSQEDFQKKARLIFQTLDTVVGRSLGAYGAPTIISDFPYSHATKDGFTIAKSVEFGFKDNDEIDRAISMFATDICARLNYAVGDGTTSAIIAVNQIYNVAMNDMELTKKYRPRDILKAFAEVKDEIIKELEKNTTMITKENLADTIRKIVYVSSNGDEKITNLITEAYETIGAPAITSDISETEDTYMEIINGYRTNVRIGDKIYVNRDNGTCEHKNVDVIMFDHKVTSDIYNKIIAPLAGAVKYLGRHLLCLAPWYDDVLIQSTIRRSINKEFAENGDSSLIIGAFTYTTPIQKKNISDLAMLLNTQLLDKGTVYELIEKIDEDAGNLFECIDINDRAIPGIKVFDDEMHAISSEERAALVGQKPELISDKIFRLGFADTFKGGWKTSIFEVSQYNKTLYDATLGEAEESLKEVVDKFASIGSYTKDVIEAQTRVASLKMKTATIYVGGASKLTKGMMQDSVDDAIRAAESAFRYGYVQGCNLTLMKCIKDILKRFTFDDKSSDIKYSALRVLFYGFRAVYHRVLTNAFIDRICDGTATGVIDKMTGNGIEISDEDLTSLNFYDYSMMPSFDKDSGTIDFADILIRWSFQKGKVFDLEKMEFSDSIINSTKTDSEILTAVIDLLGLLLTGNQVLMVGWNRG